MGSLSSTNGKNRPKRKAKDEPAFRFINHDLTPEQKNDLAGYVESGEWDDDTVGGIVERGYSYKLSPDARGGGFRAHFIDLDPASADYNTCLSGRGSTPRNARSALLYRFVVLAPEGWGVLDGGGGDVGEFG